MNGNMTYAFLHGGGQGSWVWRETIAALDHQTGGACGHVFALDVPGCGAKRERSTRGTSVQGIAAELVEDLESANLTDVMLVGHSQAGQLMGFMTRERPELFSRLVYVACSIPLPGQSLQQMIGNGRHGDRDDEVGWPLDPKSTSMEERYRAMFCNDMDPEQAADFLARLGKDTWPMETYVHNDWPYDHFGRVPATYVICLKDKSLPVAWQETFASRFKAERRIQLDAGHQAMITQPEALAEILRREAEQTF